MQIKLMTASNDVQWSQEEYAVTRTPTLTCGRYMDQAAYKNDLSIHVSESDLRQSKLIFLGEWGVGGEGGGGRHGPESVPRG